MNSTVRKSIAGFEMLTGIFMLLNISYFLIAPHSTDVIPVIVHILFFLLYAGVAYGGRLLWEDKHWGYTISIVAQSLQLFTCELALIGYKFTSVFYFFVYYRQGEAPGFEVTFPAARYALNFFTGSPPPMVGINLVPLVLLALLVQANRKHDLKKE